MTTRVATSLTLDLSIEDKQALAHTYGLLSNLYHRLGELEMTEMISPLTAEVVTDNGLDLCRGIISGISDSSNIPWELHDFD